MHVDIAIHLGGQGDATTVSRPLAVRFSDKSGNEASLVRAVGIHDLEIPSVTRLPSLRSECDLRVVR
jgi:hypothetical protein